MAPDFEWKTKRKKLEHPNTSFLPVFEMVGTKSTVDANLDLIEQKVESLKDEFSSVCTSKDLTKPFDTVYLPFFFYKMRITMFKKKILNLLRSYLENRQQYVSYKILCSNFKLRIYDVSRSSLLHSLLFLLNTNDLPKVCRQNTVVVFADGYGWYTKANTRRVTAI